MISGRLWSRVTSIPWQPTVKCNCSHRMSKLCGITIHGCPAIQEKRNLALSGRSALKFFSPLLLRRSVMSEKTACPSLSEHIAPECLFSRKALEQSSPTPATTNLTSVMRRGLLGKFSSTNRA